MKSYKLADIWLYHLLWTRHNTTYKCCLQMTVFKYKYIKIYYYSIQCNSHALNLYQFCWEYTRGLVILDAWKFVTLSWNQRATVNFSCRKKIFCSEYALLSKFSVLSSHGICWNNPFWKCLSSFGLGLPRMVCVFACETST